MSDNFTDHELLLEIVRAQNRANEILGHIRWIVGVSAGIAFGAWAKWSW